MLAGKGTIIRGLSLAEYHAHPSWSKSNLVDFRDEGPARAYAYLTGALPRPGREAFRLGALLDALATGEETKRFAIEAEDVNRREGKYQKWKKEMLAEGRVIVSPAEIAWAHEAYEQMRAHPRTRWILENADAQVSLRARLDAFPRLEVQSRPDWLAEEGPADVDFRPWLPDLKTTCDLPRFCTGRDIVDFGYDIQAALASICARAAGLEDPVHELIVIEKKPQPRLVCVPLGPQWIELGTLKVVDLLRRIDRCAQRAEWPRVEGDVVLDVEPPTWELRKFQEAVPDEVNAHLDPI